MNQNTNNVIKMILTLLLILLAVGGVTYVRRSHSQTLTEYAQQQAALRGTETAGADDGANDSTPGGTSHNASPDSTDGTDGSAPDGASHSTSPDGTDGTDNSTPGGASHSTSPDSTDGTDGADGSAPDVTSPSLIGATLNQSIPQEQITRYTEGFYYAPLSDDLIRYITGTSYPDPDEHPAVSYDDLRYVHIWHYDFDGEPAEGELICNQAIAQDLVEIFYELYYHEYQIEKVRLIDEYGGDDTASMEDNNTSCFNYRTVEGSSSLSRHALGLAVDVNPYYNPYVTYTKDGQRHVSPEASEIYADRSGSFPYKIDEEDLCFRLFEEHGFIWGGNWNSLKDYQHFQKTAE